VTANNGLIEREAPQISKRFSDTGHGVSAAGQSARNFYNNFLQFTARYRRARYAILLATNQIAPPPLLPAIFTCVARAARRLDRPPGTLAASNTRALGPTPRGSGLFSDVRSRPSLIREPLLRAVASLRLPCNSLAWGVSAKNRDTHQVSAANSHDFRRKSVA
jgi:hypothetical protein